MSPQEKLLSLALVVLSLLLLYPGISQPVMTVVGTLDRAGMVEIGQEAVIDARVKKALANNPDGDVERLRRRKGRTVRFLSGIFNLDEVSGRVEVYHKSSSVLDTVQTLAGKGHALVAALVALFSMVIPTLKNIMLLVAVFAAQSPLGRWMSNTSSLIGKWSMADVFLVALFVG
ncbi:MAG: paraquat-inducible protein A, partial [Granulosicoccaceae bacterium]